MAPSAQNTGTLAAVGSTVRLTPPGLAGFGIQIAGTWAGTVQFEGSLDGVTFRPLSATPINGTVSVSSATATGIWQAAAPLVSMQVRMSAWTSGVAVVTLNAVEAATGGAAAGGGGGGGAVTIADGADVALGSTTDPAVVGDNDGTVNSHLRGIDKILADVWDAVNHWLQVKIMNATLAVTQSGVWNVNVTGGTSGGTAQTDMSAYAQGSGTFTPGGGTCQSVITNLTDGTAAAFRLTDTRSLMVNLRSSAGDAIQTGAGTSTFALRVELPTDGTGKVGLNAGAALIGTVGLYADPANFVSGAITTAMTGTTSTSLIAAPAAGLRNYITQVTVSNAHATVGTDVVLQDGNGGTALYTIPAAALYGGAAVSFPTPLRQPTTATALFAANVTTGASVKISASGYKAA